MMLSNCDSIKKKKSYSKYLNVDKMFSFINERTVSRMDTLFNLACSSRPLADASYNLKIGAISVNIAGKFCFFFLRKFRRLYARQEGNRGTTYTIASLQDKLGMQQINGIYKLPKHQPDSGMKFSDRLVQSHLATRPDNHVLVFPTTLNQLN